jgi:hypothetical protein
MNLTGTSKENAMKTITTWVRHNQGLVASAVLCSIMAAMAFGCNVTTENPFQPDDRVDRQELQIEAQAYAKKLELAYQDLDRKDEIIRTITEVGLAYAQGGGVNPIGVASTLLTVMGLGAVVDNRRKDAVIKSKDNALNQIVMKNVTKGTEAW